MARALLTNVGLALNFDSANGPANGLLIYSMVLAISRLTRSLRSLTNVSTTAFTYPPAHGWSAR